MSFNDSTIPIRCISQYTISEGLILKQTIDTVQNLNAVILKVQYTIARNPQN